MTLVATIICFFATLAEPLSEVEVWNRGVDAYRDGEVTNALAVLRPLLLSKDYGARAGEIVAALEFQLGNREAAADAAQIALRAHPKDARALRNFARAVSGIAEARENRHIDEVLKANAGKDASALLKAATDDIRKLFTESGVYRTNAAPQAVKLADAYSARAEKLADLLLPVREAIGNSVTNELQAASILADIENVRDLTLKAAKELSDLDGNAYSSLSEVEHGFTRFRKMTAMPPDAIDEDIIAQSNAWQDVESFNGRDWQHEALDYTRAFRAKFPMWARAYEQQAEANTNQPPFTAEAQAKISALATEVEKLQLECCEKHLPPSQEEAIRLLIEIRDLLPKGQGSGQGAGGAQSPEPSQAQAEEQEQPENSSEEAAQAEEEAAPQEEEKGGTEEEESKDDAEVEAILKKAQERTDEHEADKKARMRKMQLPPNERDW